MPAPALDRIPELLALAEQRAAVRRLRDQETRTPDILDDEWRTLNRIEYGLSRAFWQLAHRIAATIVVAR